MLNLIGKNKTQENSRRKEVSELPRKSCGKFDVNEFLSVLFMTLLLSLNSLAVKAGTEVEVEFTRLGDATHLEFKGERQWDYEVKRFSKGGKNFVEMSLPNLSNKAMQNLMNWSGPLVDRVSVEKIASDERRFKVLFTVKESKVKSFDYLTESPSRLVIDFYFSDEVEEKKKVAEKKAETGNLVGNKKITNKTEKNKKKNRMPAGTDYIVVKNKDGQEVPPQSGFSGGGEFMHGIFDGADVNTSRFIIKDSEIKESAIQASKQDIFLKFPPLRLGNRKLKEILDNAPEYEILRKETEENKIARLLLVLFKKNKLAMFTKTLKFFRSKYPKSIYNEIVGYAEADLDYKRWLTTNLPVDFEIAIGKYSVLMENYPRSKMVFRTYQLMGYSYLQKKDPYNALKTFQRFKRFEAGREFKNELNLAIAESLLVLNKHENALALYNKIIKKSPKSLSAIESEYIKGDAYFSRNDYKNAVRMYRTAINKHPKFWGNYPNSFFNLAESLFWLGKYKESLDANIDFLKRFPSHVFGGYAMTRIGELLEILGGPGKKSMGAYLESYFRYKSTPGADLARIRVLSGRMKDMKSKALESALLEMDKIVERSKIDRTDEFVKIKISDGYYDRKEYDKSSDELINFFQKNPTTINQAVFKKRIARNIASKINGTLRSNKPIEALAEYYKRQKNWLRFSDRLDIKFDLGLAYEKAGIYKEAEKIYKDVVNKLYVIDASKTKKGRDTFETLPPTEKVNLRLAAVSSKQNNFVDTNNYLKEIRKIKNLSDKEKIEMVQLAAAVAEEKGKVGLAKSFLQKLINNWRGQPEFVSSAYVKLATLQVKSGEYHKGKESLEKVILLQNDSGNVEDAIYFQALKKTGDLQLKQGERDQAIKTYSKILKEFEGKNISATRDSNNLESLRYKVGKLLFDQNKVKEAEKVWGALGEKKRKIWSKIAEENLESEKWKKKYKKYINRIPAMSKVKSGLSQEGN